MFGSSKSESSGKVRRRSSRRSANRSAQGDWLYRFRKLWRRHIVTAMAVLSLFFAGFVYFKTYVESVSYEGLAAGMKREEVLYVLGQPDKKYRLHGEEAWAYSSGERLYQVGFDGQGVIDNLLCTSKVGASGDCYPAQRVHLGMTEDEVWYLLGKPPVQKLDGTAKIIAYPALGLTLKLVQFKVAVIATQPTRRPFGVVPSVIRILMP